MAGINGHADLNIIVSNAENGQGVEGVLLDVFDVVRDNHTNVTTASGGLYRVPLVQFGLYIVKPVSYPKDLFCLICDYEIVYTETGVHLVSEPIDALNVFLLPKKVTLLAQNNV